MPPPTDATEIRMTRADGTPMRFSTNLLNFLANRNSPRRFHLGDWLQSLDGETLGHLRQLANTAQHDSPSVGSVLEDLLSVVLLVVANERQTETVSFTEEQIVEYLGMLDLAAALERLRRQGRLTCENPISIEPEAVNSVILSGEALAEADEIRRRVMRRLH
jgi:hypothetical protein